MAVKVVSTPSLPWSPKNRPQNDVVLASKTIWLGTMSSKLSRTHSLEYKPKQKPHHLIRRTCSANFDNFNSNDEEFSRKIQELALQFQNSSDENQASIEMKANCVDLPISLRMIKRKKNQFKQNTSKVGETAYCSVKKAFSSMVFIIRELYSYTLQLRETLLFEDLQAILSRVRNEMHASFVWLFQQVFSHTPTLMIYIMILLANFTVHSMSSSAAFATTAPPPVAVERELFSVASSSLDIKTTSFGGSDGGGNQVKSVGSGMDGDDWINNLSANINRPIFPRQEEETVVWNAIVDEASRMQGKFRDEFFSDGVIKSLVSPVTAKVVSDKDYEEYFRTELVYQTELVQEPNNVLLLANYAHFLHLVVRDYHRAEEYYKRAISVEPKDAEAHCKYANFLWHIRNDLWAAEETFLEAISVDPTNSFYAANYAHFLWNTGGEETCFPLDFPEDDTLAA
ncbi:hypothetical protein RND81_05G261500 [Saponaria officinalis]|uniref:Uncharacterized protein n=1 Tax=Saponaria officinalis TaxID=3572 RepID=A0AAW1L1X7_SAPOF